MPKCRSCGAEILWKKTRSGKNMPVDPDPIDPEDVKDGDFVIFSGGAVLKVGPDNRPREAAYLSHFSTCPDADKWRKS